MWTDVDLSPRLMWTDVDPSPSLVWIELPYLMLFLRHVQRMSYARLAHA